MNSTACDDVIVTEISVDTNPVSSLPLRQLVHFLDGFFYFLLKLADILTQQ